MTGDRDRSDGGAAIYLREGHQLSGVCTGVSQCSDMYNRLPAYAVFSQFVPSGALTFCVEVPNYITMRPKEEVGKEYTQVVYL